MHARTRTRHACPKLADTSTHPSIHLSTHRPPLLGEVQRHHELRHGLDPRPRLLLADLAAELAVEPRHGHLVELEVRGDLAEVHREVVEEHGERAEVHLQARGLLLGLFMHARGAAARLHAEGLAHEAHDLRWHARGRRDLALLHEVSCVGERHEVPVDEAAEELVQRALLPLLERLLAELVGEPHDARLGEAGPLGTRRERRQHVRQPGRVRGGRAQAERPSHVIGGRLLVIARLAPHDGGELVLEHEEALLRAHVRHGEHVGRLRRLLVEPRQRALHGVLHELLHQRRLRRRRPTRRGRRPIVALASHAAEAPRERAEVVDAVLADDVGVLLPLRPLLLLGPKGVREQAPLRVVVRLGEVVIGRGHVRVLLHHALHLAIAKQRHLARRLVEDGHGELRRGRRGASLGAVPHDAARRREAPPLRPMATRGLEAELAGVHRHARRKAQQQRLALLHLHILDLSHGSLGKKPQGWRAATRPRRQSLAPWPPRKPALPGACSCSVGARARARARASRSSTLGAPGVRGGPGGAFGLRRERRAPLASRALPPQAPDANPCANPKP
mmetsp:Transcript_10874/g.33069  ORF Transcript_10874/g.33069 Transcript_10874/m.33069 type:complete len:562 (-) Transcript_10874:20-1705(-)